jgi:signal transduction histidine kinase
LLAREHTLELDIAKELPLALADRDRMIQVLTNLLGNAIKYTPDKGEIVVTAVHEKQHRAIHVTIQDTGLGIQPNEHQRIFSKFFRSEYSDVRDRPGTGLGLYITKSLIEKQNGHIWFDSKYGEGTAFHFTLPVAPEKTEEEVGMETAVAS